MTWTTLASVPDGHYWAEGGMCGTNGHLYAFSHELSSSNPWMATYDIAADLWTVVEASPLPVIDSSGYGLFDIDVVADGATLWVMGKTGAGLGIAAVPFDTVTLTFGEAIYPDPTGSFDFNFHYATSIVLVGRTIYAYGVSSASAGARFLKFDIDTHDASLTNVSAHDTTYRSICTDGTTIFGVEGYLGNWGGVIQPTSQSDTGVIEFYDIATDTWTFSAHTDPHFRNDNMCAYSTDGKVWAIGGGSDDGFGPGGDYCVDWVSSYDIATDTWTVEEPLDQPRSEPLVAHFSDVLYVLGGDGNGTDPSASLISRPLPGGSGPVTPVFALPFYDSFDRPDADSLGAPWSGDLSVVSGEAASVLGGSSGVDFGVADTVISVVAAAASPLSWLAFREADDGSYWRVRSNALEYVAADATVTTFSFNAGATIVDGDVVRVYLRGSVINVYINGARVVSVRDTRNASASASRLYIGADSDRFDEYHMTRSISVGGVSDLLKTTLVKFAPNA